MSKRQPSRTHGAADAADDVVGLEHEGVLPPLGQQVGGGQASGARAGDDDGCFGGCGHEQGRLVDPRGRPGGVAGPPGAGRRRGRQGTEMLRKASSA